MVTPSSKRKLKCPRPKKKSFKSKEALLENLCKYPELMGMQAYLCVCGRWHMGHKKGKK